SQAAAGRPAGGCRSLRVPVDTRAGSAQEPRSRRPAPRTRAGAAGGPLGSSSPRSTGAVRSSEAHGLGRVIALSGCSCDGGDEVVGSAVGASGGAGDVGFAVDAVPADGGVA